LVSGADTPCHSCLQTDQETARCVHLSSDLTRARSIWWPARREPDALW